MGFRAGLCTLETTIGDKPDTKNDVIKDERDPSTDMSTESEEKVTHSGYNYLITVYRKRKLIEWYSINYLFYYFMLVCKKKIYVYAMC